MKNNSGKEKETTYKHDSIIDLLKSIVREHEGTNITFFELSERLHLRGFGVLLFLFALPACIPLLLPPLPTLFAIPILFFSVQIILQKQKIWLPKWIGEKSVAKESLELLLKKASPYIRQIERFIKPRYPAFFSPTAQRVMGIFAFIFAVSIAIPLPMTNYLPAMAIVFLALGLLAKDGLFMIASVITGLFGIFVTSMVIFFGKKVLEIIFS